MKKTLKQKSEGTYLWVNFVVNDLQKMEISEVEESLDQLPQGLDTLYERILEQIDPVHRDLTLDILRWCAFAVRPLTLSELTAALIIQPTSLLDKEAVLRGKLSYCGHFLSISNDAISLVHQSAYDFLTRKLSTSEKVPWFSLSSVEVEQSNLASACIGYFHNAWSNGVVLHRSRFGGYESEDPFLEYAARQWHSHFGSSSQQGITTLERYPEFFSNKSWLWKAWAHVWFQGIKYDLLYVAVDLGLTALMQRILEEKGHWLYWEYAFVWRAREEALIAASGVGHLPIVKLLINNGVYVDCRNSHRTPLFMATFCGHREVVEFLLARGANINGTKKRSPLSQAIERNKPELVKLLLEWKPRDCTRPRQRWPSLRKILNTKFTLDVNCRDEDGNTPLHAAAWGGNIEIIEILLAHPGIDAKLLNKWGLGLMRLALIHCRSDVVQSLVKSWNMPLPEPDENCGWGAVHFAALNSVDFFKLKTDIRIKEKDKMLPYIIEKFGVNPQLRTAKVGRPNNEWHGHHFSKFLSKFYNWGNDTPTHSRVYAYILDREIGNRASISGHGSCYETALSLSIQYGNKPAIRYLLDRCKIDPDAPCRGCDGATPLHVAAQSLQADVVGILISRWKVDVNCTDRYQRTPLHLAVGAILPPRYNALEGKQVINELVTAGAQLSAIDVDGRTPRDLFEARKDFDQEKEEVLKSMDLMRLLMYE